MTDNLKTAFKPDINKPLDLPQCGSWPEAVHKFDPDSVLAIQTAMAAGRPLLIRGEPGIGKSQIARAAAEFLRAPLITHVINARAESEDLLYTFDAVSRLAQAQLMGSMREHENRAANIESQLAEKLYVRPGCLWWAFNWESALKQSGACRGSAPPPKSPVDWDREKAGCVVLIDEIDKADTDVPNSLLESLGNLGFYVPYTQESVALQKGAPRPLVIITTNEERELPAAFLRRCLVYQMSLPPGRDAQLEYLKQRGKVHFPNGDIAENTYLAAAEQLLRDREDAKQYGLVRPGCAEYLDLLTALADLCPSDAAAQRNLLDRIGKFALRKNPEGDVA